MSNTKIGLWPLIPVFFCFCIMGFVDVVGIASNYVQKDLELTDSAASIFLTLVFIWFLVFSVPASLMMNRIGRRNTVLVSLGITLLALALPVLGNNFTLILIAFSLLGIGNVFMQTSLNPLVSNLVSPDKLAGALTFGQFVKAIVSFSGPFILTWGSLAVIPHFGLSWRIVFPVYGLACIAAIFMLGADKIEEDAADKVSGFGECVRLLGRGAVFLAFLGIICHVGIDVGTNATAPRILMERLSMSLEEAGFATSLYFIFRTCGCLGGAFVLTRYPQRPFFILSTVVLLAGLAILAFSHTLALAYLGIAMVGLGNSNVFSIIFAQALNQNPSEQNEVSGLMIMGIVGGALFPPIMGICSDMVASQIGAIAVMAIGGAYLVLLSLRRANQ